MADIRLGINPTQVDTVAQFPLGMITEDPRGGTTGTPNRIKYCKFLGTVTVGQAVRLDVTATVAERHATVIASSAANQKVEGISLPTTIASGQFGWIAYSGVATAATAATIVAGALLWTTGTAGTLDDTGFNATFAPAEAEAVVGGRQVIALTTTTAGFATVLIQN